MLTIVVYRDAFQEMIDYEEWLFNLTLPSDYVEKVVTPEIPGVPEGKPIGLRDVCTLYNITNEEDEEEIFEDCDKYEPYDCPVKL